MRGLDHFVVATKDLDAAARVWESLGFTVGPENHHPFGTKNRIVQLPGFFVELIAVRDTAAITERTDRRFSFAAFNRDYLERLGEGPSMLVLESRDAQADAVAFAKSGIGDFEPFFFERKGMKADGSEAHVAFTLAFAESAEIPDAAFFVCQQHRPDAFWNPALQSHANGAARIESVMLTAENPTDLHIFFSAFTGIRDFVSTSTGLVFATPRGSIEVMTPVAFASRCGVRVDEQSRLRGLRFGVTNLDQTVMLFETSGISFVRKGDWIIVWPDETQGTVIVFQQAAA